MFEDLCMKKSLIKNMTLGFACLLGVGVTTCLFTANGKHFAQVKAESYEWSHEEHGDGSELNPYLIYTVNDLYKFRDIVNGDNGETRNSTACAKVMNDIYFTGTNNWPNTIGLTYYDGTMHNYEYCGTFDGNNFSIIGLNQDFDDGLGYNAFFGEINTGAVLKNIILRSGTFTTSKMHSIAALAGKSTGATVTNCHAVNFTIDNKATSNGYAAGLIRWASNGTRVEKCSFTGSVHTSSHNIFGGIASNATGAGSAIINCFSNATITQPENTINATGGIVGYTFGAVTIDNNVFCGTVPEGNNRSAAIIGNIGSESPTEVKNNYYISTIEKGIGGTPSASYEAISVTPSNFNKQSSFSALSFNKNPWQMSYDSPVIIDPVSYITLDNQGATDDPGTYGFFHKEKGDFYLGSKCLDDDKMTTTTGQIEVPSWYGHGFLGYYTEKNGNGTQYINENGFITSSASSDDFNSGGTLYASWEILAQPVDIAAGFGVKSVFTSTNANATSGNPSGTAYNLDDNVYGFAELKPGYAAPLTWVNVSGSIYRVNNGEAVVVESSPIDFGTQEAVNTPAVVAVKQLIGGIGEVSYPNSKPKIDEARKAYDELSADEKVTVDNYNVLTAAEDSYSALKEEALPKNLSSTYGKELSSVTLPSGWSWKNPSDKVGDAGNNNHTAIYKPNDYAAEETLTVSVGKADPVLEPLSIEAPYDVALSQVALPSGYSWVDNTLKTDSWGEHTFKANYTPSDLNNYNPVNDIDVTVNVKWILVDPTQGDVNVTINGDTGEFTVDISIKVEVKTEISMEEKKTEYANIGKEYVKPNEDITAIYDVKLIRTTNGVEEEIQPSQIKEGTTIFVQMAIPEELVGKDFRLLHIHNDNDVSVVENYAVSKDGKTLVVEVDKLSQFAFLGATDKDNGFDYSIGLPGWALALIIIGGILLIGILVLLVLFFICNKWIIVDNKAVRAFVYNKKNKEENKLFTLTFKKYVRKEEEIYKNRQDALNALNK